MIPRYQILGLACLLQTCAAFAADSAEVYTGTLGKQPIVVQWQESASGEIEGRYFYEKYHRDIKLSGEAREAGLHLVEGKNNSWDTEEGLPQLDLERVAEDQWVGTWQKLDGKPIVLTLRAAEVPAPAAAVDPWLKKLYADNLYEYLRLSGLTLEKGEQTAAVGYTLQWWLEPDSGISVFEILDGYPDAQRKAINELLRGRLWQGVSDFHDCVSAGSEGSFEQGITPNRLSPNVISISGYMDYYCGGAYPDWGDNPINLNARTAQALTLEDILWVGEGDPVRYVSDLPFWARDYTAGDFDAYASYRETYLAPWLIEQLKALYPESTDENDCGGYDSEAASYWRFPTWSLNAEGIVFTPSYPHVMAVCNIPVTLPYAVARQQPGVLQLTLP
ncbi:MAG: hypothetical protein LBF16_12150 [Pseudomonadales bacterium]|jgi:hypothetical protein|nr:hypothetical protein [Pseudomonadales bacterium]